jgi:hypothetical protein
MVAEAGDGGAGLFAGLDECRALRDGDGDAVDLEGDVCAPRCGAREGTDCIGLGGGLGSAREALVSRETEHPKVRRRGSRGGRGRRREGESGLCKDSGELKLGTRLLFAATRTYGGAERDSSAEARNSPL